MKYNINIQSVVTLPFKSKEGSLINVWLSNDGSFYFTVMASSGKYQISIHCTKDQSNACMCENDVKGVERTLTVLIVTHVTQVERVESGVCGSYTTPYADVWKLCIKWPLAPARREGYCNVWAFHLGGLAVHHWSVQGGSFVKFLGLVNYKGDCRQDAQPIPNSYIN